MSPTCEVQDTYGTEGLEAGRPFLSISYGSWSCSLDSIRVQRAAPADLKQQFLDRPLAGVANDVIASIMFELPLLASGSPHNHLM